eukprot:gnl/MRDRNA2_/MRDRNA2_80414_c0_seq1.p1 gnl/MRDRNA2_/MRDRNA2_80414_c0~~gnl/MRDRNA2_/MRDRNA2_80414_c0_seq1.p1  ORF type:complete len:2232 (-),score=472.75 gnl/MRDRNA2_/MRDRNA2_80414_c0_seq1:6-5777(-)
MASEKGKRDREIGTMKMAEDPGFAQTGLQVQDLGAADFRYDFGKNRNVLLCPELHPERGNIETYFEISQQLWFQLTGDCYPPAQLYPPNGPHQVCKLASQPSGSRRNTGRRESIPWGGCVAFVLRDKMAGQSRLQEEQLKIDQKLEGDREAIENTQEDIRNIMDSVRERKEKCTNCVLLGGVCKLMFTKLSLGQEGQAFCGAAENKCCSTGGDAENHSNDQEWPSLGGNEPEVQDFGDQITGGTEGNGAGEQVTEDAEVQQTENQNSTTEEDQVNTQDGRQEDDEGLSAGDFPNPDDPSKHLDQEVIDQLSEEQKRLLAQSKQLAEMDDGEEQRGASTQEDEENTCLHTYYEHLSELGKAQYRFRTKQRQLAETKQEITLKKAEIEEITKVMNAQKPQTGEEYRKTIEDEIRDQRGSLQAVKEAISTKQGEVATAKQELAQAEQDLQAKSEEAQLGGGEAKQQAEAAIKAKFTQEMQSLITEVNELEIKKEFKVSVSEWIVSDPVTKMNPEQRDAYVAQQEEMQTLSAAIAEKERRVKELESLIENWQNDEAVAQSAFNTKKEQIERENTQLASTRKEIESLTQQLKHGREDDDTTSGSAAPGSEEPESEGGSSFISWKNGMEEITRSFAKKINFHREAEHTADVLEAARHHPPSLSSENVDWMQHVKLPLSSLFDEGNTSSYHKDIVEQLAQAGSDTEEGGDPEAECPPLQKSLGAVGQAIAQQQKYRNEMVDKDKILLGKIQKLEAEERKAMGQCRNVQRTRDEQEREYSPEKAAELLKAAQTKQKDLKNLVTGKYLEIRIKLQAMWQAAQNFLPFFTTIYSLDQSRQGDPADVTMGIRRKNWDQYIVCADCEFKDAGSEVANQMTAINAFCKKNGIAADKCGVPPKKGETEDPNQKFFIKLSELIQTWTSEVETDVNLALGVGDSLEKSSGPREPNATQYFGKIREQYENLEPLMIKWMKKGKDNKGAEYDRMDNLLFLKYLNWREDSESAVRVYIKVTNRELTANPSNGVLACAPQMSLTFLQEKGYTPDKRIRIAECDAERTNWYEPLDVKSGMTCANIQDWSKKDHASQIFGPFYGVYTSPDEKGPGLNLAHNLFNEDIYGSAMNKCVPKPHRKHDDVGSGRGMYKEQFEAAGGDAKQWEKAETLTDFELQDVATKCYGYSNPKIINTPLGCLGHAECQIKKVSPENLEWAPHMKQVVQQAASGYTIVLFGYGYSGSGKTYTLLGGGKTMGVMTLGLQDLQEDIDKIVTSFKELYGQIDITDGRPMIGETGIYSYKVSTATSGENNGMPVANAKCYPGDATMECLEMMFWGRRTDRSGETLLVPPLTSYAPKPGELLLKNFVQVMELEDHRTELNKALIGPGKSYEVGEWIDVALKLIMETRTKARCRDTFDDDATRDTPDVGDERCRHVRKTPNNPESSRGHLFTILDVTFTNSNVGKIVVVDCAGSEDPVAIMKDYVDFRIPDANGEYNEATDPETSGDMRAAIYLKQYNDGEKITATKPGGDKWFKLKLWYATTRDEWQFIDGQAIPKGKLSEWVLPNAKRWLDDPAKVPEDFIQHGTETWPKVNLLQGQNHLKLIQFWAYYYLYQKGYIAMVKEGVFINESLAHLKQFLLFRAGKTKSLMELNRPHPDPARAAAGELQRLDDPHIQVDTSAGFKLPVIQNWNAEAAKRQMAKGTNSADYVRSVMYSPKQFIQADQTRVLRSTGADHPSANTQPLISTARCTYGWTIPQVDMDQVDGSSPARKVFPSCDGHLVDGAPTQKEDLSQGKIQAFDPMMMISMLNFFDKAETYKGGAPNKKPTKFLMMAAIRREHPADNVIAPCDAIDEAVEKWTKANAKKCQEGTAGCIEEWIEGESGPGKAVRNLVFSEAIMAIHAKMPQEKAECDRKFKRLRANICRGSEMTLNFADEMNPISEK